MQEISAQEVDQVSGGIAGLLCMLAVMALITWFGGEYVEGGSAESGSTETSGTVGRITIGSW